MASELTLSIIKPDAVSKSHIDDTLSRFEREGLRIMAAKLTRLSPKCLGLITQSLQLDSFWKAVCSAFLKPCNLCQPLQRLAG